MIIEYGQDLIKVFQDCNPDNDHLRSFKEKRVYNARDQYGAPLGEKQTGWFQVDFKPLRKSAQVKRQALADEIREIRKERGRVDYKYLGSAAKRIQSLDPDDFSMPYGETPLRTVIMFWRCPIDGATFGIEDRKGFLRTEIHFCPSCRGTNVKQAKARANEIIAQYNKEISYLKEQHQLEIDEFRLTIEQLQSTISELNDRIQILTSQNQKTLIDVEIYKGVADRLKEMLNGE